MCFTSAVVQFLCFGVAASLSATVSHFFFWQWQCMKIATEIKSYHVAHVAYLYKAGGGTQHKVRS